MVCLKILVKNRQVTSCLKHSICLNERRLDGGKGQFCVSDPIASIQLSVYFRVSCNQTFYNDIVINLCQQVDYRNQQTIVSELRLASHRGLTAELFTMYTLLSLSRRTFVKSVCRRHLIISKTWLQGFSICQRERIRLFRDCV